MRPARLAALLLLAAACAAPARAAQVSRDGHFAADFPPDYAWVLSKYPSETHSHIVAAWELGGAVPRHVEIAVQSLRYMTPRQLAQPAASSCERWIELDELSAPCQRLDLSPGLPLYYTIQTARTGTDQVIGFFDLGGGLVYCVLAQVTSGSTRPAALQKLWSALSTLRKADAFQPPPPPKCESDYAPVYENWPRAGDWKCRLTVPEETKRILVPTIEPFEPLRRLRRCPPGLTLARVDEPLPGDYGCVDFSQTTQRLVERFNHTQVFMCAKTELPVLLKRDGRKREFSCEKTPKDAPLPPEPKPY